MCVCVCVCVYQDPLGHFPILNIYHSIIIFTAARRSCVYTIAEFQALTMWKFLRYLNSFSIMSKKRGMVERRMAGGEGGQRIP